MSSILAQNQEKEFTKQIGAKHIIKCVVRYDDRHKNGHNTFSITGGICEGKEMIAGGSIHYEIAKHFPELKPLIKWHLMNSDGPLHYISDTIYWAKNGNLDNARRCSMWFDATLEQLSNESVLMERLPRLIEQFKKDIEEFGFIF